MYQQILKRLPRCGDFLFALLMVYSSIMHFRYARFVAQIVPPWMPWRLFWAYFTGVALLVAGISIALRKQTRLAATLLGIMLSLFVLLIHAPSMFQSIVHKPADWNVASPLSSFGQQEQQADHKDQAAQPHSEQPSNVPTTRGQRIPEPQFREHCGREHTFVINRPVIVDNRPRFLVSGFWFEIVDPWPADWAYTDQWYVDDIGGTYYLFNPFHPGIRLVVLVVG